MENIPPPPYPGPSLTNAQGVPLSHMQYAGDSVITPQQLHSSPMNMQNIPAPPYPGPPLQTPGPFLQNNYTDQQMPQTSGVQAASFGHLQAAANSNVYPQQANPGPLSMQQVPVPPYPGPPLQTLTPAPQTQPVAQIAPQTMQLESGKSSKQVQQFGTEVWSEKKNVPKVFLQAPANSALTSCHSEKGAMAMERTSLPAVKLEPGCHVQQNPNVCQKGVKAHQITVQGAGCVQLEGRDDEKGNQRNSNESTPNVEDIPAPPYPGPPLQYDPPNASCIQTQSVGSYHTGNNTFVQHTENTALGLQQGVHTSVFQASPNIAAGAAMYSTGTTYSTGVAQPTVLEQKPQTVYMQQPSPSMVVQQPPAPVVVQQPPAPVVVQQPPAPMVVQQPPAPVVIQQAPPPMVVQQAPRVVVHQQAPQVIYQQQTPQVIYQQQTPRVVVQQQSPQVVLQSGYRPGVVYQTPGSTVYQRYY